MRKSREHRTLSIVVPRKMHRDLKVMAAEEGVTVTSIIIRAAEKELKRYTKRRRHESKKIG